MKNYDLRFYFEMEVMSITSAEELIPMITSRYQPMSVADVGCGTGAFAQEFINNGVNDVRGYEGIWMKGAKTILPKDRYVFCDLTEKIITDRIYDICLCLEVAEHLDVKYAKVLVESLTAMSNRVVFSAAIPKQGGNHHVNEQWPEYWSRLFAEKGFILDWDPRISIWDNSRIAPCYRQNLLVFHKSEIREVSPPLPMVHPAIWTDAFKYRRVPFWFKIAKRVPSQYLRLGKRIAMLFIKGKR
jgi:SAM-dependent methyltransferase